MRTTAVYWGKPEDTVSHAVLLVVVEKQVRGGILRDNVGGVVAVQPEVPRPVLAHGLRSAPPVLDVCVGSGGNYAAHAVLARPLEKQCGSQGVRPDIFSGVVLSGQVEVRVCRQPPRQMGYEVEVGGEGTYARWVIEVEGNVLDAKLSVVARESPVPARADYFVTSVEQCIHDIDTNEARGAYYKTFLGQTVLLSLSSPATSSPDRPG